MNVLVTGAAGFIGSQVVSALLGRGELGGRPIRRLILADAAPRRPPPAPASIALRTETGDIADGRFAHALVREGVDAVFALAATLTSDAEADFGKGLRVNVLALIQLLELLRTLDQPPARFVFPSSIATFGGTLPGTVEDDVLQRPQTSYGAHKAIAEHLINDYTRKGFIDGRALRLPVVIVRPGPPSQVVSDRVAALIREPLLGHDVACPFRPESRMPVASVRRVADALLRLHDLPGDAFGDTRAMNLPSLSVTVGEIVESVQRVGAGRRLGRVTYAPEARLQAIMDGWPDRFVSARATAHGIGADASIDEIVRDFMATLPPA